MAVPVPAHYFRVDSVHPYPLPRVELRDRSAAGHPKVYWVYKRHLERLLFHRADGGSSGVIWKLLNSMGLGNTSFYVTPASVKENLVTRPEYEDLLRIFRDSSDALDPSSLGRIRSFTLLPIHSAATVARLFGHSAESIAFLRAFQQPVPTGWELQEEQEKDAEEGGVDLALEEKIEEQGLEAEETSIAQELTEMADFQPVEADDGKMKQYTLERVSVPLQRELDAYQQHRSATFSATREGVRVAECTSQADVKNLLRFFGWLHRTDQVPEGAALRLSLLGRADLGTLVKNYLDWLKDVQQIRFCSIANYLNGLVMITKYVYDNLDPPEETLAMPTTPFAQLINLRDQAQKEAKTQGMFDKRKCGGWINWEEVQECRVNVMARLAEQLAEHNDDHTQCCRLLREAVIISLLSLIPPDRVGVVRKLRYGHTLKRRTDGTLGWRIDLTKLRDGHKTSRFYGPANTNLPEELNPVLDAYAIALGYEKNPADEFDEATAASFAGIEAYLFHPIRSNSDRPLDCSGWTQHVKGVFLKHARVAICPKTLRKIFITWLRDNTDAPAVLRSAAHAMKHSEETQAGTYDTRREERLNEAAFGFTLEFAQKYVCAALPDLAEALQTSRSGAAAAEAGASTEDAAVQSPAPIRPPSQRSGALPPGWTCEERTTPKCTYKRYRGPNGEKMITKKAVWAYVSREGGGGTGGGEDDGGGGDGDDASQQLPPGTHELDRVLDAKLSDETSELVMYVRWKGTDGHGQPWPDEWIPASWGTPAARRDAKTILHRKSYDDRADEPELSVYEQERSSNVQRNERFLASLELGSPSNRKSPAKPKPARGGPYPRMRGRPPAGQRWDPVEGRFVDHPSATTETEDQQVHRMFETLHGREAHNVAATQAEAVAGNWAMAEEGRLTRTSTAENNTQLLTTRETMEDRDEMAAQAVAAERSARKRAVRAPSRLELGTGPASKWKAALDAVPPQRYQSLHAFAEFGEDWVGEDLHSTRSSHEVEVEEEEEEEEDEFSTGGFQVGDEVDALGFAPSGIGRMWFCARVTGIRAWPVWPPITVKYISTLEGSTNSLELPSPNSAHVPATDVRLPEASL